MADERNRRVLTIQSHVVSQPLTRTCNSFRLVHAIHFPMHSCMLHRLVSKQVSGYCGNKAATFPLQTLGYEVDVMNTVEFSNHTGTRLRPVSWGGRRVPAEELKDLFDGMEKNGLVDDYTHLLTGKYVFLSVYVNSELSGSREDFYAIYGRIHWCRSESACGVGDGRRAQTAQSKIDNLAATCSVSSHSRFRSVCDPVMGDDGELYVSNEVVPLYRQIMRLADVVTPNQFEAETLASTSITSIATAHQALSLIHDLGPTYVVITTVSLPIHHLNPSVSISSSPTPPLFCLGSHRATPIATPRQFFVSFPTYPGYFTGTGDLFSALLVARLTEALEEEEAGAGASDLSPLARAVLKVVASVSQVVKRTRERQKNFVAEGEGKPGEAEIVRRCELQVVQGKKEIENPVVGADITFGML
ncbi:Ribokinase-like protein [Jimgerdemannia flammicorona]|uniref:pyridoxal kinase n=1 Tax=Jimgerdemannia flammicorona TaxID=994334 RepID=A0A433QPT7_9FUNG|nr:Ribokinase-like protein [Jimgerdemannia flammicorona]